MPIEYKNLITTIDLPSHIIIDQFPQRNPNEQIENDIERSHRRNPRLINSIIVNNFDKNSPSIIDYALEPLLPLIDACQPLLNIVPNLHIYIKIALENCQQAKDGLTQDESASIFLYTMETIEEQNNFSTLLNNYLENRFHLDEIQPWNKYLKLFLTALSKLPFGPPRVVWCGIKTNISEHFIEGRKMILWKFTSCTNSLKILESDIYLGNIGQRTLFSIETINGKSIQNHSQFNNQQEIILLPGTHLQVKSRLNPSPDLYIIHLKQIKNKKIFLQPPFQGY
jgi:hypothetical protein